MTIYQNLIAGSGFLQGPTGATGPAANTSVTIYKYVATAGQTTFSGNDSEGRSLTYTPTGIFVTYNGATLNPRDEFTATNGTSVVLDNGTNGSNAKFTGIVVGDIYANDGTTLILDNGTNGTDATFKGDVTGDIYRTDPLNGKALENDSSVYGSAGHDPSTPVLFGRVINSLNRTGVNAVSAGNNLTTAIPINNIRKYFNNNHF